MFRPKPHSAIVESAFFKLPDTLLLVFGSDLALYVISEAWAAILGYPMANLRECSFTDLLHEEDRGAAIDKLASLDAEHPTLLLLHALPASLRRRCCSWLDWTGLPMICRPD